MLKTRMQYNWWKYLLVILVSAAVWCTVFNSLAVPKDEERLNILFVGEDLDTVGMEQEICQLLPTLTQQSLRQVKVAQTQLEGTDALQILATRVYEYDIVIISQSYMQENIGNYIFSGALTPQLCDRLEGSAFYSEDSGKENAVRGIILEPGQGGFAQYYAGVEHCYLFPSGESVNFAGLNGKGQAEYDCALRITEYLTGTGKQQEVALP